MKPVMMWMAIAIGCGLSVATGAEADPAIDQTKEKASIEAAVDAYVAAYNHADAKALAALWSPDAVYTNPLSGDQVVGREAIEKQFSDIFAGAKGARLEATSDAIEFVSPNVAVERGTATVSLPEEEPERSGYTAVYVKRDGTWLMDRVTEGGEPAEMSPHDHLAELEWMVGTWVDQDEQSRVDTVCQWTKNQTYLLRLFAVSVRDQVEMAGMQIIGWDPAAKQIRSWVFDSEGGFGEGVWSRSGDSWDVRTTGTLPDGSHSASTNIITYLDENTFTWQSVDRTAGGDLLPNVDEVVVVRQSESNQ